MTKPTKWHVRPAKTHRHVRSAKTPGLIWVSAGRTCLWVFAVHTCHFAGFCHEAVRTCHFVGFVMRLLKWNYPICRYRRHRRSMQMFCWSDDFNCLLKHANLLLCVVSSLKVAVLLIEFKIGPFEHIEFTFRNKQIFSFNLFHVWWNKWHNKQICCDVHLNIQCRTKFRPNFNFEFCFSKSPNKMTIYIKNHC